MHSPVRIAAVFTIAGFLLVGKTTIVPAQHDSSMAGMDHSMSGMMPTPLGISMNRMGSGTTWLPEAAPIASMHTRLHGWDLTGHGLAFGQYIHEGGPRGGSQLGSLNWGMLMASRSIQSGMLQFRTMLSLDALGVTARGYPSLLQTGESFHGEPLHDRQHPHDFWMELGVLYLRPITTGAAIELYAAPSGEPALGPVAFMHRPSAVDDPFAPISHHWQDATHISFGVATIGIFSRRWKVEASVFNGREPDEKRWGFDFAPLDSYSGRVTWNPNSKWSVTAGGGRLNLGGETIHRVAGSLLHGISLRGKGQWASALIYGANIATGGRVSHSVLLESEAILDRSNTVFGRIEWSQKSARELVLDLPSSSNQADTRRFNLAMASAGYIKELVRGRGFTLGLGTRGSVGFIARDLRTIYGGRMPVGWTIFLRLRPGPIGRAGDMMEMPGAAHEAGQ